MSKDDKIVFCTGGGCTAKLGAGVLSRILEKLPRGENCLLYTSPSPRDVEESRMPSSA